MEKVFVILVFNYDEANSEAEILDNKFFLNREDANNHLKKRLKDIQNDHWVGYVKENKEDFDFKEDDNVGTYVAEDSSTGQRFEAYVVELER